MREIACEMDNIFESNTSMDLYEGKFILWSVYNYMGFWRGSAKCVAVVC